MPVVFAPALFPRGLKRQSGDAEFIETIGLEVGDLKGVLVLLSRQITEQLADARVGGLPRCGLVEPLGFQFVQLDLTKTTGFGERTNMAKRKPKPEEHVLDVVESLDATLQYHIGMILSYEKRNSVDELHASHQGDPVFELFGMTDLAFTKKRWAAGFANSCATNLGRFTDKATKIILAGAFNVTPLTLLKKVTITANNRTETEETDGVLLVDEVDAKTVARLRTVTNRLKKQFAHPFDAKGLGFEFRGRYGKNDDTLIQKDEHMAHAIRDLGAVPILATFSTNNAKGAITRLRNSWVVVAGMDTINLLAELTTVNLVDYLKSRERMLAPVKTLLRT